MFDIFGEISTSITRNKLRIALTGFSIAWGIFMLIVLLGAGNGLLNGMMSNFNTKSLNIVRIYPSWTSKPYKGIDKWRQIKIGMEDLDYLRAQFPNIIDKITPTIEKSARVSFKQEYSNISIQGNYPEFSNIENFKILSGRSINEIDIREQRKIIMIPEKVVEVLFRHGENPIGQWVNVYEIPFMVIGTYKSKDNFDNSQSCYIPITTAATIFQSRDKLSCIRFSVEGLNTIEANEAFETDLRTAISKTKYFDPTDRSAVWIWNQYDNYLETKRIFDGLRVFIWIIGLATLIAGIVGISNIMLITVKERTREFGIRKALGASPRSILWLVLLESVGITMIFGYIGMLCGIGLTQLVNFVLEQMAANSGDSGQNFTIFLNPTVDMGVILIANGIMVIAGVIAGYVPAKRAVSIKPVEALASL